MQRWPHLGRKSEIPGHAILLGNNHPQLIDDFLFAHFSEMRANETVSNNLGIIRGQELGAARDAVADNVLQESAWKLANPVLVVRQNRLCVTTVTELVAVKAFHVNWRPPQVTFSN